MNFADLSNQNMLQAYGKEFLKDFPSWDPSRLANFPLHATPEGQSKSFWFPRPSSSLGCFTATFYNEEGKWIHIRLDKKCQSLSQAKSVVDKTHGEGVRLLTPNDLDLAIAKTLEAEQASISFFQYFSSWEPKVMALFLNVINKENFCFVRPSSLDGRFTLSVFTGNRWTHQRFSREDTSREDLYRHVTSSYGPKVSFISATDLSRAQLKINTERHHAIEENAHLIYGGFNELDIVTEDNFESILNSGNNHNAFVFSRSDPFENNLFPACTFVEFNDGLPTFTQLPSLWFPVREGDRLVLTDGLSVPIDHLFTQDELNQVNRLTLDSPVMLRKEITEPFLIRHEREEETGQHFAEAQKQYNDIVSKDPTRQIDFSKKSSGFWIEKVRVHSLKTDCVSVVGQAFKKEEDRFCSETVMLGGVEGSLHCVFDGHRGCEVAELLANVFPKTLVSSFDYLSLKNEALSREELIFKSIQIALANINEEARLKLRDSIGSTATGVLHIDQKLYSINIGNSAAFLLTSDKKFIPLTVKDLQDTPFSTTNDTKLNVGASIGDFDVIGDFKRTPTIACLPGDVSIEGGMLLITSKGIGDRINMRSAAEAIRNKVREGVSLEEAVQWAMTRISKGIRVSRGWGWGNELPDDITLMVTMIPSKAANAESIDE